MTFYLGFRLVSEVPLLWMCLHCRNWSLCMYVSSLHRVPLAGLLSVNIDSNDLIWSSRISLMQRMSCNFCTILDQCAFFLVDSAAGMAKGRPGFFVDESADAGIERQDYLGFPLPLAVDPLSYTTYKSLFYYSFPLPLAFKSSLTSSLNILLFSGSITSPSSPFSPLSSS